MKETEWKPCPFCGCEEVIAEINHLQKVFHIYCGECPAEIGLGFVDANIGDSSFVSFYEAKKVMNELEELWNRRADNEQREAD